MTEFVRIHHEFADGDQKRVRGEYLWAERVPGAPNLYKIGNIPFHADEYAIGDIVRCGPNITATRHCQDPNPATCSWCTAPEIAEIVENHGNQTGLLLFETHLSEEERRKIGASVRANGTKTEWADEHLLAFDVPADKTIQELVGEWIDKGWAVCSLADAAEEAE